VNYDPNRTTAIFLSTSLLTTAFLLAYVLTIHDHSKKAELDYDPNPDAPSQCKTIRPKTTSPFLQW